MDSLRGTKTAHFLNVLAGMSGHGGLDKDIKTEMSSDSDVNLAPYVASISKACKRMGVGMPDVLVRQEKRIRAGKYIYHYRLSDAAADFISMTPDLESDEEFETAFGSETSATPAIAPTAGSTRIQQLQDWLRQHGPLRRKDVISRCGIPQGTVGVILREDNGFKKNRDDEWYVPEQKTT